MSSSLLDSFVEKDSHNIHFLFSYGSNSSLQVKERVNSEESIQFYPAYIKDYVRIFCGVSKRWNGGIASITPCEDSNVYGIVLKLTNAQLAKLDTYETGYTREKIKIVCQSSLTKGEQIDRGRRQSSLTKGEQIDRGRRQSIMGKERIVEGFVYIKNESTFTYLPSQTYMESIRKMLDERRMNHTQKITIRCIKDGVIKSIALWEPEYGIKLLNM